MEESLSMTLTWEITREFPDKILPYLTIVRALGYNFGIIIDTEVVFRDKASFKPGINKWY